MTGLDDTVGEASFGVGARLGLIENIFFLSGVGYA